MRALLLLVLWAQMASSQPDTLRNRPIRSGSPQVWTEQTLSMGYVLPDPVGAFELSLVIRDSTPLGRYQLISGSIAYERMEVVEFPRDLLQCLPSPRPRSTYIRTFYLEPNDGTPWFEKFENRVVIEFGASRLGSPSEGVINPYPEVEIVVIGNEVRQVNFVNTAGQRRTAGPIVNGCPRDLIGWASQ